MKKTQNMFFELIKKYRNSDKIDHTSDFKNKIGGIQEPNMELHYCSLSKIKVYNGFSYKTKMRSFFKKEK